MDTEQPKLSVLAVDDEPMNLKLLDVLLKPLELNIEFAEDGTKGLELLEKNQYDLLLFDIMMPGIDGLELCKLARLNPQHKDVPVLILTAFGAKESLLKAFEAGAVDYITKPFYGPELVFRIKAQLKLRQLQRSMETFTNELNLQVLKAMKTERELLQSQQALSEANKTLVDWAHKDALTGLWNRRKAWDLMEYEAERSNRQKRSIGIAVMDLDKFKNVNDTLGHEVGDAVLKEAAAILSENLRKGDILARWGGEEFLLVFPETDLEGSFQAANKMRLALQEARWELPGLEGMTVSIGVTVKQPGETWTQAFKQADDALYRAKESGRNRVEVPLKGIPS